MSGPKIAAIYGLIPNKLGYCGPRQEILKKFIAGELGIMEAVPVLKKFEAAYAYYELIAQKNSIKNGPFNKRVVEAYWLGNDLLDKVSSEDMRQMIIEKFAKPGLLTPEQARQRAGLIPEGSKPHHSFHVLVFGSITGRVQFTGDTKLKDTCRVGWGLVKKITGSKITVSYNPLVGQKIITFGGLKEKTINWDKNILSAVKKGGWVSFHWNYAIQALREQDIINLHKYTQHTLNTLYGK